MKDLDFDELDKAVNSLMSKSDVSSSEQSVPITTSTPRPLSPMSTPSNPVATSSSSSIPISLGGGAPRPALAPAAPPTPAPTSSARPLVKPPVTSFMPSSERSTSRPTVPVKRSGRFMDLVPAGSASQSPMKSSGPRQGTTLSPLNDNVTPDAPAAAPPAPSPAPVIETPQSSTQPKREFSRPMPQRSVSPLAASMSMNTRSEHDDMPDPLDLHEQQVENEPEVSRVEQETQTRASFDQPAPVSPFLSDAKVDKRPLGASAMSMPTSSALDPPQPNNQAVPAELRTDLLKVESDFQAEQSTTQKTSPAQPQKAVELTSPISIAQQYKQQPRSGDQSHAPVYDTAAHPVTHPEKKKSHLLIYIVIAVIVVIVGGGVAALFSLGYI